MAPKLRAVQPGEVPAKPPARARTRSIAQAAASGSERELLVTIRKRVADAMQDPKCPPAPLAALTRSMLELTDKIAALDAAAGGKRGAQRGKGSDGSVADEAFDATAI